MSHNFYPLDGVALDEMCNKVPIKDNKAGKLLLGFASSLATDADTERLIPRAALSFGSIPQQALIAGGAVVALGVGTLVWGLTQKAQQLSSMTEYEASAGSLVSELPPREDAVLVFGSTGKLGRQVVLQLVENGRTVVAAARDASKAQEVFKELGLDEGLNKGSGKGVLAIEGGIDITNPATLKAQLWRGVTQVVCAVGPIFGRTSDGNMGYLDNMTSERVDAEGVKNVAAAAKEHIKAKDRKATTVVSMGSEQDIGRWERLDDVIMGGQSSSTLRATEDGAALFSGDLVIEGGGFCGARTKGMDLDLSAYDGIALQVEGDGQTYKLNLKTADQENVPEDTFQATFDTVAGQQTTVHLPWRQFVPVKRARVDPSAAPLDPSKTRQLGLVLSRFEFNGLANPNYKAGRFSLKIMKGIQAYTEPRPALVFITSAGVERNAIIGDDEVARKKDIPIVQLNPGGTLNHKYAGEWAVRSAELPYTVIRSTGLTSEDEDKPWVLEAQQGDRISGKISRKEVASVAVSALSTEASIGKTVEIRRSEAGGDKGKGSTAKDLERLFLIAQEDRHRPRIGLSPLPMPVPPPPPPSESRTKEILSDERVQAAQKAGRGGRVRSEEESAAASSVTVVGKDDSRAQAAPAQNGSKPAQNGSKPSQAQNGSRGNGQSTSGSAPENVQSARQWIGEWRAEQEADPVSARQ
ncbi:g4282 [Coccomyxa viridis]|uniref:G4282 protein n=1 Tax=Coccomyxa viridis TaxID=1274662 RepID=A0ABP1FPZ0_9CHLO